MAGLYVHIPFCHHKCIYCDFYSIAQSFDKRFYVDALVKEIEHRKDFLNERLDTIYFGGGTPSLLKVEEVSRIFEAIHRNFSLNTDNEITFEANPENISAEYVQQLKSLGVNRISLGVQSFDDRDLSLINRSHNSLTARKAIETILENNIENISIDLISNLPYTTLSSWEENLRIFLEYSLPHISCYTLMREEGTMLDKLLKKEKLSLLSEEDALKQLDLTMAILEGNGYNHYETSSYSKLGFHSRHNMSYWTFQDYLGVGAGAHSYKEGFRMWNEDNVYSYTERINRGEFFSKEREEVLEDKDKYNEYVMLASRMKNGLKDFYVKEKFPQYYSYFSKQIRKLIQENFLTQDLTLTKKGWHLQDEMILALALD